MRHATFVYLSFCILLLSSCKHTTSPQIEYEKSFAEISQMAAADNTSFCIILSNPDCPPCRVLHDALFEDIGKSVGRDVLFNIVDVSLPQNKWFEQLLAFKALPTALLFSGQGKLTAVIQGSGLSSRECIKNVVGGKPDCSQYLYDSSFPESVKHEDVLMALNLLLKAKAKLEKQEDATNELTESASIIYYPYTVWLLMQNEKNKGNEQGAISLAKQLLTFQRPMHLVLYADLYLEARYVINPRFDIKDAPLLELENNLINLGECKVGEKVPFSIKLKNTGKDVLRIYDVSASCTCLELLSEREYILEEQGEDALRLEFTPDHAGTIERKIFVATNEIEPMRVITVVARARK